MSREIIPDAGPSVVLLNAPDLHHGRVCAQWDLLESPFLTCEAVVTNACIFARRLASRGQEEGLQFVGHGSLDISFLSANPVATVAQLAATHPSVLVFLADACLVHMSKRSQSFHPRIHLRRMS